MADLFIDDLYQRPLEASRVRGIVRGYEPAMMGALEVSDRANGTYAVFDGQHRLAAALELGLREVGCLVHQQLTVAEEADLFERLQRDRKPVHNIYRLRARAAAGDDDAREIYEALAGTGYSASPKASANSIGSAAVLSELHRYGALMPTLQLLREVWGGDEGSTYWPFVRGVGEVLINHGELAVEHKQRLRTFAPVDITRRARGAAMKHDRIHNLQLFTYIAAEIRRAAKLRRAAADSEAILLNGSSVFARAYSHIKLNPYSTSADVANALGVSHALARAELMALVARGRLISWGRRERYLFSVPDAPAPHPKLLIQPNTKAAELVSAVEDFPWITADKVREFVDGDTKTEGELWRLANQGVLATIGPATNARFAVAGTEMPSALISEGREPAARPQGEWAGKVMHAIEVDPGLTASEAARAAGVPSAQTYKLVEQFIAAGAVVRKGSGLHAVTDTMSGDDRLAPSATSANLSLSSSERQVLDAIVTAPGRSAAVIGRELKIGPSQLSKVSRRLEASGLIRREAQPHESGRGKQFALYPVNAGGHRPVRIRAGEGVLAA